mgnify:CR=1 FL=1
MFWVLETILPYLKINKEVTKDNVSFRILTELNFGIFVACSIFVGSTSLIGEPILCQYKGDSEPEAEFINTFCWIHGTRDLEDHIVSDECKPKHNDVIPSNGEKNDEEEKNKNLYYQWVVFMLLFSAVLFKIPTWIWSFLENGLMKLFNSENHLKNDMWNQDEKEIEAKAEMQANSFRKIKGRNMTMVYYAKFMLCQMLAWVMLFVNFYLTDLFLDGSFKTYGSDVLKYYLTSVNPNPMCLVFPTKVGCPIKTGGSGGGVNNEVEYCILSQNIINEKIYLVLWFWFYALIGLLAFQVVLELIILVSPFARQLLIIPSLDKELFLTPANQRFLSTCTIGDWFVLYQISKNNHQEYFFTFLGKLSEGYNEVVTNDTPTENYCNSMEKTQEEV